MSKKKIYILNGSHANEETFGFKKGVSNTDIVINEVINSLNSQIENCEIIYRKISDLEIAPCDSCVICCVPGGRCPKESNPNDDVKAQMTEMENSDVVIWASPVYCMNVSGMFKLFTDRLGQYFHMPNLIGKPCFSITTYNLSDEIAKTYLEKSMKMLGMQYIGNLSATVIGNIMGGFEIQNKEDFIFNTTTIVNIVNEVLHGKRINPSQSDVDFFEKVKKEWVTNKTYTKKAYQYWEEKDLINAEYYY